jgi:galactose oxidase
MRQLGGVPLVKRFWTAAVAVLVTISGLAYVSGSWIYTTGHASMTGPMAMVGNRMPMLTATAKDSFTPKVAKLTSSGWTAVASDQQSSYPAGNAIDGNQATIWHSRFSPTAVPLPHSITIDMHATNYVSGLTYLPRQDTSSNGNIGQYSISVSGDGTNWGTVATGTWADSKSLKTAAFSTVSARYVRLTAFTEAG